MIQKVYSQSLAQESLLSLYKKAILVVASGIDIRRSFTVITIQSVFLEALEDIKVSVLKHITLSKVTRLYAHSKF